MAEITDLGKHQMILGYTWLKHHNPDINWETGQVRMTHCPWTCRVLQGKSLFEQSMDMIKQNGLRTIHAIKKEQEQSETPKSNPRPEDLVPKAYHKHLKVFSKKESERMPVRKQSTLMIYSSSPKLTIRKSMIESYLKSFNDLKNTIFSSNQRNAPSKSRKLNS